MELSCRFSKITLSFSRQDLKTKSRYWSSKIWAQRGQLLTVTGVKKHLGKTLAFAKRSRSCSRRNRFFSFLSGFFFQRDSDQFGLCHVDSSVTLSSAELLHRRTIVCCVKVFTVSGVVRGESQSCSWGAHVEWERMREIFRERMFSQKLMSEHAHLSAKQSMDIFLLCVHSAGFHVSTRWAGLTFWTSLRLFSPIQHPKPATGRPPTSRPP